MFQKHKVIQQTAVSGLNLDIRIKAQRVGIAEPKNLIAIDDVFRVFKGVLGVIERQFFRGITVYQRVGQRTVPLSRLAIDGSVKT